MKYLQYGFSAALGAFTAHIGFTVFDWQFWVIMSLAAGWATATGLEYGK